MPVLGHAFAGLAVADVVRPSLPTNRLLLWTPGVVLLNYLPDIVAQAAAVLYPGVRVAACHSAIVAIPAAILLAIPAALWFRVAGIRAFALILGCIWLHDLLDLVSPGHTIALWWPISNSEFGFGGQGVEVSLLREVLVYGGLYLAFRTAARFGPRNRPAAGASSRLLRGQPRASALATCVTVALTGSIFAAASVAHVLGEARERQLQEAWSMINRGDIVPALQRLDQAERWPSRIRPGRIDYARGEAFALLHDRTRAEAAYLQAYQADPGYFWVVVDLASFYASSDEPLDVRRRKAGPYAARVSREFMHERAAPRLLASIRRKLADPATEPSTQPATTNRIFSRSTATVVLAPAVGHLPSQADQIEANFSRTSIL